MQLPSLPRLFPKVGIDIGTSRTRIWLQGSGICLDEPSCLAVDTETKQVIAAGEDARVMQGRVGKHIAVVWPIANGSVTDPDSLRSLLTVFFRKARVFGLLTQPIMMVSTPAEATSVARDSTSDLLYQLGAREVYTIAQPLAASIGAGVPIADASGSFLFQMGAGIAEGAVISLGSLIHTSTTTQAGQYVTGKLQSSVKQLAEVSVSFETAEELQQLVASSMSRAHRRMLVTGQEMRKKSPREIEVTSEMLAPVVMQMLQRYEQLLRELLSQLPPELTVDVIDKGILLSGGLAQLDGADSYFVRALGIPVSVVDTPDQAVIRGIGTTLENLDLFKESLGYQA